MYPVYICRPVRTLSRPETASQPLSSDVDLEGRLRAVGLKQNGPQEVWGELKWPGKSLLHGTVESTKQEGRFKHKYSINDNKSKRVTCSS